MISLILDCSKCQLTYVVSKFSFKTIFISLLSGTFPRSLINTVNTTYFRRIGDTLSSRHAVINILLYSMAIHYSVFMDQINR